VAVASLASAAALVLASPWDHGGGLTERALAAVGDQPVLHVATDSTDPNSFYQPVSLSTGKPIPVTFSREVWFDQDRQLERTISRVNGFVYSELLQSPAGWFDQGGPVYTCAWIAAHPVQATKARVSCRADMQNGRTPRHIPEQPPPALDPALAGFVDNYRSALASGQARQIGTGVVEGRNVIWLRIYAGKKVEEEVAIDADSYKPLLVRTTTDRSDEIRVTQIETEPYDDSMFSKPSRVLLPSIWEHRGSDSIALSHVAAVLGRQGLWLGHSWNGFQLTEVARQQMSIGFCPLSGRVPIRSTGVTFEYRRANGDVLTIREATQCQFAFGPYCGRVPLPGEDTLLVGNALFASALLRDGLYVAFWLPNSQVEPVTVARSLTPLSDAQRSS
jgi:hypothetical protein